DTEPRLADFAAVEAGPRRRLLLVELIKADQERRLSLKGRLRPLEAYLADFPELQSGGVPAQLLFEEFPLRQQRRESVTPGEPFERFPDAAGALAQLLGVTETMRRTAVSPAPRTLDAIDAGQALDDFDLLRLLGKGSFARVFLAWQKSLHRLVALKVS